MCSFESMRQAVLQHVKLVLMIVSLANTIAFIEASVSYAEYDLPNNDADCPANCRQIPWVAGSDVWNSGRLPVYTGVNCTVGLTEGNGTTDNASVIANCLAAINAGEASVLPAGMFYVNDTITIPSNKVLRGQGSTNCSQGKWLSALFHGDTVSGGNVQCTTLKLGPSGAIRLPGAAHRETTQNLASGYTKGSQTIKTFDAPSDLTINDWIVISELEDSEIPATITGSSGDCMWCGEQNAVRRPMTQIVQVTSVSGNDIGISRPLYYTFKSTLTPRILKLTNLGARAGIESLKLWGADNSRTEPHIRMSGSMQCWVKDVETYNTPNVAKAYPVYTGYSAQGEIRDSYFHFGQINGGDRNYGFGMFGPNSDFKVENNIYRENRHALSQEGGGSGNVFLYNYIDDMWTDDATYLARTTLDHGAHPFMFLLEGNIISHYGDDNIWGSSSHGVLFRNWLWGDATGNYASWPSVNWGFVAMDIEKNGHYMSAIGNILGGTAAVGAPGHVNWSTGTVYPGAICNPGTKSNPVAYELGCRGTFDSTVRSTAILHGNYDYKTLGVAFWDGGADHTLRTSMYYSSKPAFFGSCTWPPFGPEGLPTISKIPARQRYLGETACVNSSNNISPAPPNRLKVR
jgi:hypothetical protein